MNILAWTVCVRPNDNFYLGCKMAGNSNLINFFMDVYLLKTVRDYHYFCRFELENMSIYQGLPALGLTQSI
jgi:hypothetical protein